MKKILALLLCACLLVCIAGCTGEPDETTSTTAAPTSAPTTTSTEAPDDVSSATYDSPMAAVSAPPVTETKYADDQTVISTYSYQDIAVTLPDADVAQTITLDMLNRIDATVSSAEKVHSAAATAYSGQSDWYPYFYSVQYTPMRLDQNVLSFYGTESSFDGSPRSISACVSVSYSLTTGDVLTLQTILQEDYSADVLCDLIIEGLSAYSEDELFFDYRDVIADMFSTNVPVESWYFTDQGLCFYFAPYEIASYAMGTVVSEIPYEKLSGLLREQYFPGEELSYTGSILVRQLTADNTSELDAYSQFAEVVIAQDTETLLLTTNGSVLNLRVSMEDPNASQAEKTTVFAAAGIGPTDAIILELPVEDALNSLHIIFESNGETQTLHLVQDADGKLTFSE